LYNSINNFIITYFLGSYKGTKPLNRQTNHYSPAVNGTGEVLSATVPCTPLNPPAQYQQIPVLKPADPPPQTHLLTHLYNNNMAGANRGTNTTSAAAAAAAAAAKDRRSNVVKEVAKLKKNREERRQRQAELKEEKEALMNMDPGNPNWEFLAMIRFVDY